MKAEAEEKHNVALTAEKFVLFRRAAAEREKKSKLEWGGMKERNSCSTSSSCFSPPLLVFPCRGEFEKWEGHGRGEG